MPSLPTKIVFACEKCGKQIGRWRMRWWLGSCRTCEGQSWTLIAYYTERDVNVSWDSIQMMLATGFGWFTVRTYSNYRMAENVPGYAASALAQDRARFAERVSDYLLLRDKDRLREQGARTCQACESLFVPTQGKPWTHRGFCSKSCAAQSGEYISPQHFAPQQPEIPAPTMIAVACPAGHEFKVLANFLGLTRNCPECGAKCRVERSD